MALTFITRADLETRVTSRILDLLATSADTIIEEAELQAISTITDRLSEKYQVAAELAKTVTDRNRTLLRWIEAMILYAIYARIPDDDVPARVIKDYDDTMAELEEIQKGRLSCSLTRVLDDTTGEIVTRIRMGSDPVRTHNPFEY